MPRAALVAGPLAVLATASAVGLGVLAANPATTNLVAQESSADLGSAAAGGTSATRDDSLSRAGSRVKPAKELQVKVDKAEIRVATNRAVQSADEKLWTTAALNLWDTMGEQADKVGLIDEGERVLVTGREGSGRVEIVVEGESRWVTAGYLSEEKPVVEVAEASCTNGTSVSSGVSANIVKVHEAVCAAFPEITTYGTFRGDGEHAQGIAVDIMVSGDRGWEVAEFIRENYSELGVSYLIYSQQIWSVERSGEGWRAMSDRGSSTANHYDHVHVTTY